MNREKIIETMARAMCGSEGFNPESGRARDGSPLWRQWIPQATAALAAIEAAGVRLVPVDEKPGQGWLHEAVKDASLRAAKNTGAAPQMLFAPILWAMQDALAASPYAKDKPE